MAAGRGGGESGFFGEALYRTHDAFASWFGEEGCSGMSGAGDPEVLISDHERTEEWYAARFWSLTLVHCRGFLGDAAAPLDPAAGDGSPPEPRPGESAREYRARVGEEAAAAEGARRLFLEGGADPEELGHDAGTCPDCPECAGRWLPGDYFEGADSALDDGELSVDGESLAVFAEAFLGFCEGLEGREPGECPTPGEFYRGANGARASFEERPPADVDVEPVRVWFDLEHDVRRVETEGRTEYLVEHLYRASREVEFLFPPGAVDAVAASEGGAGEGVVVLAADPASLPTFSGLGDLSWTREGVSQLAGGRGVLVLAERAAGGSENDWVEVGGGGRAAAYADEREWLRAEESSGGARYASVSAEFVGGEDGGQEAVFLSVPVGSAYLSPTGRGCGGWAYSKPARDFAAHHAAVADAGGAPLQQYLEIPDVAVKGVVLPLAGTTAAMHVRYYALASLREFFGLREKLEKLHGGEFLAGPLRAACDCAEAARDLIERAEREGRGRGAREAAEGLFPAFVWLEASLVLDCRRPGSGLEFVREY